jgi:small subunit ribosomal protein S1
MTNTEPTTEEITNPEAGDNEAAEASESMESLMAAQDAMDEAFKPGQLLTGKVVRIDSEGVLVDVGYKTEGVIPLHQLSHRRDVNPEEIVKVGEQVDVSVTRVEGAEGTLILSKKRADLESAWFRVIKAQESGEILTATCTEQVKGGLIVDLGLRGFVPASHVDLRPVHDLSDYVGESLELKVLEIDKPRRKVVLSRKKALEELRGKMRENTMKGLDEGQIISGTVARLTNFGAFINLGGADGLVHISELSWKRIKHPNEVVRVGEQVDVRVLSVSPEKDRISLSLRQARPDPWTTAVESLKVNDIVPGKVSKLAKNYVFVEIADGVEGLVPISELADFRVSKPAEHFKPDQEVKVKVLEIRPDSRRILLSIRQASGGSGGGGRSESVTSTRGDGHSGFTIGDRLQGQLQQFLATGSDTVAVPQVEPQPEASVVVAAPAVAEPAASEPAASEPEAAAE